MIPGRSQGAERFGDVPEGRREACPKGPKVLGLPGGRAVSQAEGREQGDRAAGRRLALAVGCCGCGCRTGSVGRPRCFAGLKKLRVPGPCRGALAHLTQCRICRPPLAEQGVEAPSLPILPASSRDWSTGQIFTQRSYRERA